APRYVQSWDREGQASRPVAARSATPLPSPSSSPAPGAGLARPACLASHAFGVGEHRPPQTWNLLLVQNGSSQSDKAPDFSLAIVRAPVDMYLILPHPRFGNLLEAQPKAIALQYHGHPVVDGHLVPGRLSPEGGERAGISAVDRHHAGFHRHASHHSLRPASRLGSSSVTGLNTTADVAVIGGSGLYALLDDAEEHTVDTPFGLPSDPITVA